MLERIKLLFGVIPRLGWINTAYVAWYRLSTKLGYRKRKFPTQAPVKGLFFQAKAKIDRPYPQDWMAPLQNRANRYIAGELFFFSHHWLKAGSPPDWRRNLFVQDSIEVPLSHWTDLADFNPKWGDIKSIWEPSRFDWLTDFSRAYRVTGESRYLDCLNDWLLDWSGQNPLNLGPNWKCGQEASIRLMKLISAAMVMDQLDSPSPALQTLVSHHLQRIAGNMRYAIAQDNNHGTSEAAGLWLGASFLLHCQSELLSENTLRRWEKRGKRVLEETIKTLVGPQGTFSQQSMTYHRVVCDTISWLWIGLKAMGKPPEWSELSLERIKALYHWQLSLTDRHSGDAPNLGSNDGAMLENLHSCDYRDFRPSTQLLGALVLNELSYSAGPWDEVLWWRIPEALSFNLAKTKLAPEVSILDDTILLLQNESVKLVCKLPNARFRPSSEDALHLDFWVNGVNLLCDSGTYSYNAGEKTDYYKSISAHNTVQFGGDAQMPMLSRFLYAAWLQLENYEAPVITEDQKIFWQGAYRDYHGNRHQRSLSLDLKHRLLWVEDFLSASQPIAKEKHLYWHLPSQLPQNFSLICWDEMEHELNPERSMSMNSKYYLQEQEQRSLFFSTHGSLFKTKISF